MPPDSSTAPPPADYLRVDAYLRTEIEAHALAFALERGLVDRLAGAGMAADEVAPALGLPEAGARLLLDLLRGAGVLSGEGSLALTPGFRAALAYRDYLEAKLAFAGLVAEDVHGLFPLLVGDVRGFMARSKTFALFRYDRAKEATPAAVAATRRWVAWTTALTRHEAGPALAALDLSAHRRMLDVGGNSGEFALQACGRAPGLGATVFDLPAVCAIGREHVGGSPDGARVRFVPGDLRRDPLPGGHDLVTLKSVLHDWPEAEAAEILSRAAAALAPGGRLAIYERAPLVLDGPPTYAMIPNLVFLHFLREPDLYERTLTRLGFREIECRTIRLETAFFLLTARRPA